MPRQLIPLLLLATFSLPATARPAPWYWWVSSSSEARVCWQTSPGKGWIKETRPFRDARCSIRL